MSEHRICPDELLDLATLILLQAREENRLRQILGDLILTEIALHACRGSSWAPPLWMAALLRPDPKPIAEAALIALVDGLRPRLEKLDCSNRLVWNDLCEKWVAHVEDTLITARALRSRAVEIAIAGEAYDTLYPASRCVVADLVNGSFTADLPENVRQGLLAA